MDDSNKLWIIDLGEEFAVEETIREQPETTRSIPQTPPPAKRVIRRASPPPAAPPKRPARRLHFAYKLALTYLLGPFALLLWQRGRSNPLWSTASLLSGIGSIILAWQWRGLLSLAAGNPLPVPLLLLTGITGLAAFTSWARALHLAFASGARSHTSLPAWMRTRWAVTGLGLLAPGLGLYLAGSYRRAVAALWALWPVFPAGVILAHAGWTWRRLRMTPPGSPGRELFEHLVLAAAVILVLGLAIWLIQALAGLHLKTRLTPGVYGAHGDRYALALLAAVIALVILAPPGNMASVLDRASARLHDQGYRFIPLQLSLSAHRLDPAEVSYSLQVAALHQELGDNAKAVQMKRSLDQDLQVYYGMLGPRSAAPEPTPQIDRQPESRPEKKQESWQRTLPIGPQQLVENKPEPR